MSATLQSQTIQTANNLIAIGQNLYNINAQIAAVTTEFSQLTMGAVLAALPTCAVNADGSLGTADGSPNAAHVINTGTVTTLSRAISANDLASLVTLLQAVQTLLNGSAVTQQGQAPQLLAKLTGG